MKIFKFFLPMIFIIPSLTHAQLLEETEAPVIVKKTPDVIVEDSSEHNRIGKKYELTLTPFAIGPIPGMNVGINAGTYLTRNTAVILGYSKLSEGRSCWGSMKCSDSGYTYSAYYRYFTGNSFYVSGGIEQRHVSISGGDTFINTEYSFDGDSTGAAIVIGNQWQWSNFALGCDWVGLNFPIASSVTNVKSTGSTTDLEQDKKYYVTNTMGILLRFRLGMTF